MTDRSGSTDWRAAVALVIIVGCASSEAGRTADVVTQTTTAETVAATTSAPTPAEPDGTVSETLPPPAPSSAPEAASNEHEPMPQPEEQARMRLLFEFASPAGPGLIEQGLGFAPLLLEPGTYETDAMYTPMRFTIDEHTRLVSERPTFAVLVDHSADELWDVPLVHWIRPDRLVDPADHDVDWPERPRTIDGWDFDAWLDDIGSRGGIEIERTPTTVGGADAVRYDIRLLENDDVGFRCGEEGRHRCIPLHTRFGTGPMALTSRDATSLWVIDQGEHRPILAFAAVEAGDGFEAIDEHFGSLMASIELGDPVAVPIGENHWEAGLHAVVPADTVEFPILDGVRFDNPEEYYVEQQPNWSIIWMEDEEFDFFPPNVEIAAAMQSIDGTPIESADQLAQHLVDLVGATRGADREIDGRRAVVIEMFGVQADIPAFHFVAVPPDTPANAPTAWWTLDYVEMWAVDTDDGVLVVTAEGEDPNGLEIALGLHEHVRNTLEILD